MNPPARWLLAVLPLAFLTSCSHNAPPAAQAASVSPQATADVKREVRLTGVVQAIHSSKIIVPQIAGQGGSLILTKFIQNGSNVNEGDLIAAFDSTQQVDMARDAQARYDDLGHQVEQKRAQNRADAERRNTELKQAEADLAKAKMELEKGPILSEIDRSKNEQKARIAALHVESLRKSRVWRDQADAASLRYLELQRDRQKVAVDRTLNNIRVLEIRAPLSGMVAHEMLNRNNSQGHAQEGDQLFRGQPLVKIFDPSEMSVRCMVGEPDHVGLTPGTRATVYLDAYPDVSIPARFETASPVASSAMGSPIKTFTAVFKFDRTDPHLLPDLSAAVVLTGGTQ